MTAICARSGPHLRHMRRGVWPERRADGASKLKLATWWNATGTFVVAVLAAFASVSTEARAMLVYSYYSDQIIVTTDERRSGQGDSGADRVHLSGDRCVPAAPVHTALGRQHCGTGLRHPLCRAVIVGATAQHSFMRRAARHGLANARVAHNLAPSRRRPSNLPPRPGSWSDICGFSLRAQLI